MNASSEGEFDAVFAKVSQLRASGLVIGAGNPLFVATALNSAHWLPGTQCRRSVPAGPSPRLEA